MRVVAAQSCSRSTLRVFESIHDFYLLYQPRARTPVIECLQAAQPRVKRRKRTKKRSRRSQTSTHTQLSIQKLKRGACLSAASFRVKKRRSYALVLKTTESRQRSRDENHRRSRRTLR